MSEPHVSLGSPHTSSTLGDLLDVVVVGAGVAGLTAAWSLAGAGLGVSVLDARGVPGGRCGAAGQTVVDHAGETFTFPLEHGIHGVWRQYRNLRALLSGLGRAGDLWPDEVSLAALYLGLQHYAVLDRQDGRFDTLAGGCVGSLIDPLVAAIVRRGGTIRLGTPARRVSRSGDGWVVVPAAGAPIRCRAVVLAVDPPGLRNMELDPALATALAGSRIPEAIDSVVVRTWWSRSPGDTPSTGVFAGLGASNYFWLDRLAEPWRRWSQQTGGAAVECHLYGRAAREAGGDDDAAVAERVSRTVTETWPTLSGARVHAHVQRNDATHPIFAPGTLSRQPPVAPGVPGVALCGDWIDAGRPVLYLERACLTGQLAAQHIAATLGRRVAAPLPPHPPAPGVVPVQWLLRRVLRAAAAPT